MTDRYMTVFDSGREMAADESAHSAFLRDAAEQARRDLMHLGDGWQGGWDEALQVGQQHFVADNAQADVHDSASKAIDGSVYTAEDLLHRTQNLFRP